MNVASLELSKELYELSGWDDTFRYYSRSSNALFTPILDENKGTPAYDLGYLLRKLPGTVQLERDRNTYGPTAKWSARWWNPDPTAINFIEAEEAPEDAAVQLAIYLFKQGVLK